jgi:hypothetical protein
MSEVIDDKERHPMSSPTSETVLTDLWGRIISNHNQTLVRLDLGREINHNQTVVRPVPGIPGLAFNHNQTLVRR